MTVNVLIMADYRTRNSGNFIASLIELGCTLRERKDGIFFVFPDNQKGGYPWCRWLEQEGFPVALLDVRQEPEKVIAWLRDYVQAHQIDLIHSHFGCCSKLLTLHRKQIGVKKVLFHDHMDFSPEQPERKQRLRTLAYGAIYRLKGIGVVSVMEKKDRAYWLCRKHWFVPNGLSLRRFVEESMDRDTCREKLGIACGEKLCLFLGWDMFRKGVDTAVSAVALLRQTDPDVCLGLVGFGDSPSRNVKDWIRERTGIDPDSSWIHFFPSEEDMFAYHRAADVYLSASRKEAFSYGILEAISQNVPVAVSDIEGTAWSRKYGKTVIFRVGDAADCARALAEALTMGNTPSNADRIVAEYGIDRWCQRIMEIYDDMLS